MGNDVLDSRQFLATIHLSYLKSLQLINKTIYKNDMSQGELFDSDRLALLEFWPDLVKEVRMREMCLNEYYEIIVDREHEDGWLLDSNIRNNLYSTFLNESNTAVSYYLAGSDNTHPLLMVDLD